MPLPAVAMIAVPVIGAIGFVLVACLKVRDNGRIAITKTQNQKEIDLAKIQEKGKIDIEIEKRETIKTSYDIILAIIAIIAITSVIITLIVNTSVYIVTLLALVVVGVILFFRL